MARPFRFRGIGWLIWCWLTRSKYTATPCSVRAMTDAAQRAWARTLAPTSQSQYRIIADLLRHANEDHMSGEDRLICRAQLGRLAALLGYPMPSRYPQAS